MPTEPPRGTPIQLTLATTPHHNQRLFSDYYLESTLPQREDWQMLAAQAAPVMQHLIAVLQGYVPSENEAQTEDDWIKPVLKALGHTFEVQTSLETPDGTKSPDYVFYHDLTSQQANKGKKLNETRLAGRAFAVGDAKHWDRPLDVSLKKTGGDPFTNKNPSYQISFYLLHSGLEWGILTNGRLWRLYHKATAHKLDRFYEVDLPALLVRGDAQQFLYFYAFFRRAAFEPGELSVAALLKASTDYARGVSDSLKEQVYEALRHLAQGFLDYPPNQFQPDPPTLKAIYDHSLILLYRLLFILYAEARDLLPVRESVDYRESYSLKAIKEEIKSGRKLLPTSATLWPRLKAIFTIINEGSPLLNVATFNGGLFDPARHPFLEQHAVGDAHLQQAIDRLARVDGQFVDYRDLAERHLGTIYEGLLEFHLEPLPTQENGWTVALLTDRGERKATGSYYTPDYIVKYMVEETLSPVLRRAIANTKDDQERIDAVLGLKVLDPAMGSGHFPVEAMEYIARFLVETIEQPQALTGGEADLAYWKRRVAQSCIYGVDLNPLAVDLAKLSLWLATVAKGRPLSFLDHHLHCGNSLVGARLADLRQGAAAPKKKRGKKAAQPGETTQLPLFDAETLRQAMTTAVRSMWLIEASPAQTVKEVKEQEHTYSALRQELTSTYSALADLVTATHFGVEILPAFWQPLADYAAKRTEMALPQFKTWVQQAAALDERLRFFHWELEFPEVFFDRFGQPRGAAAGFDVVIGNPPYVRQEGLSDLKPYFAAAYPETYHGVADLYVYFYQQGLQLTRAGGRMAYIVTNKWMRAGYGEPLRAYFAAQGALEQIIDFGHAPIFEDADVFPCILVLEKRGPASEEQVQKLVSALNEVMDPIGQRFLEATKQALQMAEPENQTQKMIEAGVNALNAERPTLGQRVAEAAGSVLGPVQALSLPRSDLDSAISTGLGRYIREHRQPIPRSRFSSAAWSLESSSVDALLAKIRRVGVPLTQFAGVKPYRGVLTGLNEAFLIDTPTRERLIREDPRSAEIIKPYLRGQDIKRWSPEWAELWLIVIKSSSDHPWPWTGLDDIAAEEVFKQAFPAIHQHLKPLEERLRKRWDKGKFWWELRPCAYYHVFEQPKIITQDLATYSWFCFDNKGFYPVNTCYVWPTSDLYILGWLCSPTAWWIAHRTLQHAINDTLRMFKEQVETLPIAPPSEAIRAEVEPAVARLIALAREQQEARQTMLGWLRAEFGVVSPGARLEDFAALGEEGFIAEVRKRRPKSAGRLTPAALKDVRAGYHEQATPMQQRQREAAALERRLSDLVNAAYGLTPEEVALLWATAPPRMPLSAAW